MLTNLLTKNNHLRAAFSSNFLLTFILLILMELLLPIQHWIQTYLFSDFSYLQWLVLVMVLDLITGVTKAWIRQGLEHITSRALRDTVSKSIQYGSFLIVTHILTSSKVGGTELVGVLEKESILYIQGLSYKFLLLIEIKSVYENIVAINPKSDFVKLMVSKFNPIINKLLSTLKQ